MFNLKKTVFPNLGKLGAKPPGPGAFRTGVPMAGRLHSEGDIVSAGSTGTAPQGMVFLFQIGQIGQMISFWVFFP